MPVQARANRGSFSSARPKNCKLFRNASSVLLSDRNKPCRYRSYASMLCARAVAGAISNFSFSASTMAHVISSWSAKIPWNSRSNVSDHKVNPLPHSVSSAVTRMRLPPRRKPADSTAETLMSRPAWRGSTCTPWYLAISEEGRTMSERTRASSVITASARENS